MSVPAGVIVAWPGAASGIPSGWSRVTSLDSRFVKGAAAAQEPDATGGSATHTHTSPTHSHSIPSHTHAGGTTGTVAGIGQADGVFIWTASHTHTTGTSGASTGTSSATTGTWNTASNDPPYVTVIFIASGGSAAGIPDGAWAWWTTEFLPDDWSQPPAARGVYLRGAASAGDGGSTGGAASHAHTAVAHTHIWNGHTHTGGTTGSSTGSTVETNAGYGAGQVSNLSSAHTHSWSLASGATAANSASSADTGTATGIEPPHHTLAVIENQTGGDDLPAGVVAAWLGLTSAIPSGWSLCDGDGGTPDLRERFVKGADDLSEIGDTGGTVGHDHTAPSGHTHAYNHTHTVSSIGVVDFPNSGDFSGAMAAMQYQHTHSHASGSSNGTSGSAVQTVDAVTDSQPPFRTVLFIQLDTQLVVTVTEPEAESTVSAPAFDVAWDAEVEGSPVTQNDYRVRIYDEAQAEVLYDTGQTASALQEHTVGLWAPENNTAYYLVVEVTDAENVIGSSGFHPFTTSWTPPETITGITVTPVGGVS